jgi:alkanesulfonate monooxygenase SsuD/methylene tetrahydromethanopterin reductase-like flavin-dependent oxidoreductase (luciferase family)
MKVSMFHLMPHRELPDDFENRYHSIWVDVPWNELADAKRVGQYYNWTLDELIFADKMGLDGVCVNEHHQNAYGFMPSPNMMGSVLARSTKNAAIVQMGATLPTTQPPVRIAEEYAMLDCISGGRVIAGMPLGTSADANFCYGISPIEQRERYREAHDLIIQAWTREDVFAFNGKYTQLRYVNTWPKPIQKPHPPVWVPGSGSISTWDFVCDHNYCYCYLSYWGNIYGAKIMDRFWDRVAQNNLDANPYRAGFLQLVAVSETDAQAEKDYEEHIKYFFNKSMRTPLQFLAAPGYQDYPSLVNTVKNLGGGRAGQASRWKEWGFKEFVKEQFVISGSPSSVVDQLKDAIARLRVGNLMVLLQIGSMPHELTLKNIELFGKEVLPHIRHIWDEDWENHWWPEALKSKVAPAAVG